MPPFKSEAQRRKFLELEKKGKLKPGTTEKWNEETPANIPNRVGNKGPKTIQEIKDIRVKKYGK